MHSHFGCPICSNGCSVKVLNLFELFSSPKFLYANETNHTYLFMLIDIFNNIIQYQYGGNAHLIYAITRRAKLFYSLGGVHSTLPKRADVAELLAKQPSIAKSPGSSLAVVSGTALPSVPADRKIAQSAPISSPAPTAKLTPHPSNEQKTITNKSNFIPTQEWVCFSFVNTVTFSGVATHCVAVGPIFGACLDLSIGYIG